MWYNASFFMEAPMKQFEELSDDQWNLIQELMSWTPPLQRGKKRTNLRKVWNAIFYILTRGCRWIDLPQDERYANRATAHRWLTRWQTIGVFDRVVTGLLRKAACEGLIDWNRLVADGSFSPSAGRR
jgi:transposase